MLIFRILAQFWLSEMDQIWGWDSRHYLENSMKDLVHHLFLGAWYHQASYTISRNSGCASLLHQWWNWIFLHWFPWLESNILEVSSTNAIIDVNIAEYLQGLLQLQRVFRYCQAAIWVHVETFIVNRIIFLTRFSTLQNTMTLIDWCSTPPLICTLMWYFDISHKIFLCSSQCELLQQARNYKQHKQTAMGFVDYIWEPWQTRSLLNTWQ